MTLTVRNQAEYPIAAAGFVSFAPDASAIFVANPDGWRLIDEKGHPLWRRDHGQGTSPTPDAVMWTPSGDALFVVAEGRVRVLRAGSGDDLRLPPELLQLTGVTALALHPAGHTIAAGTAAGRIRVHDLQRDIGRDLLGIDPVTALCWHAPTKLLSGTENELQVWDTERSSLVRTVVMRGAGIAAICRSRVGRVAVLDRRGVQMLDLETEIPVLAGAEVVAPAALAFSREEQNLFVGAADGIYVLDLALRQVTVLPGAITEPGHLSRSRTGMFAVRTPATVSVLAPADAVQSVTYQHDAAAVRRWAERMAVTVGRGSEVVHERRPLIAHRGPTDLVGAGAAWPAFAWTPDGDRVCEMPAGRLVRIRPGAAEPLWSRYVEEPIYELATDLAGRWVAAAARNTEGRVRLFDAATGELLSTLDGGQSPVFAGQGRDLCAVPEPGPEPVAVVIYQPSTGNRVRTLPAQEGVGRLAWSADGAWLAAASDGKVIIWETEAWQRTRTVPVDGVVSRVAWSPDGRFLAVEPMAGRGDTQIFLTGEWRRLHTLAPAGGRAWAPALTWSPDSRMLARPAAGREAHEVEIWSVSDGRLLTRVSAPDGSVSEPVWTVSWAPAENAVVVTHAHGLVAQWNLDRTGVSADRPLRHPVALLAALGAGTAAEGGATALSLLADLLDLTGGMPVPALESVTDLRGTRAITGLGWPPEARIGIVMLLAHGLQRQDLYRAPAEAVPDELVARLEESLLGEVVEPLAPAADLADLTHVLQEVDDRVITLLKLLGPEAVAGDPALPLRMRGLRTELSPLSSRQHRLLSMRLSVRGTGAAEGQGTGDERAGLARHGNINRLVPTQLALPLDVFAVQYAMGNLLFRTRRGKLPPEPRAVVVLLDDTPAAFGAVGVTLRTCAHLLASSLLSRRRRCVIVPLGSASASISISEPADLIRLWAVRSAEPPDMAKVNRVLAEAMESLTDSLLSPPLVILLTHPYQRPPAIAGIRTIAVDYPDARSRPVPRRPHLHRIPAQPTAATLRSVLHQVLSDDS